MKDIWLKIGCFLTGYNYVIIKNSSEASAKSVKKYLSALLIVCIIWGFIGFVFSERYIHASNLGASIISLVMVIIVIQIERQIILTTGKSNWALFFRSLIAVVMAVVGSVIIDQIIFKEDVEKLKISKIQEEVNSILLSKTAQLDAEISALDSLITRKDHERAELIAEVTRKPFVKGSTSERKSHIIKTTDTQGNARDSIVTRTDLTLTDIPNPKVAFISTVDQQIADLRLQKAEKQKARITIRQDLENELKSRTGFLDELKLLISILTSHWIALIVWILIFIFFLALELFVLVIKFGDAKNDYEKTILHQMDMRIKMIEELANQYDKSMIKD
jgi:hypothetical protein